MTWKPTASIATLRKRAAIIATIRTFFAEKSVLEVETPILGRNTVTDPHIKSVSAHSNTGEAIGFLQTSPEYFMKRLLCAGSGSIYQITKAFRDGEAGRLHSPEFTMLEWYRVGFDHHQLMDEVAGLVKAVLGIERCQRLTYQKAFENNLGVNPLLATVEQLHALMAKKKINIETAGLNKDDCLDLLMSHAVIPQLGDECLVFITDYPSSQAALAKINPETPKVAERFELFCQGIELANGYHELTDSCEQTKRFENDRAQRERLGMTGVELDKQLVEALASGMPHCSGVALGLDRLVMLALGEYEMAKVMSFSV